jgi:hypothetical protein
MDQPLLLYNNQSIQSGLIDFPPGNEATAAWYRESTMDDEKMLRVHH